MRFRTTVRRTRERRTYCSPPTALNIYGSTAGNGGYEKAKEQQRVFIVRER